MRKTLSALVVLLSSASVVHAADGSGNFAVDGIGVRSCEDLLKIRDNIDAVRAFAAWTEGFFSAYNVLQSDTFDITPWQTIELTMAKLFNVCESNPELDYIRAVGQLLTVMTPQRLTDQDHLISVRNNGKSVFIYKSMLLRLRDRLAEEGHRTELSDDPFDNAFAQALTAYQQSKNLPATGLPDLATLNALYP